LSDVADFSEHNLETIPEDRAEDDTEGGQLANYEQDTELNLEENQRLGHLSHLNESNEEQLATALRRCPTCPECLELLTGPTSTSSKETMIQNADIGMRDERGYTMLALAARYGFRDIVLQLLHRGANPNSRSYKGTSLLGHVVASLAQAHKARDTRLYAAILSCMVALTDHGAKPKPSAYDEFSGYTPSNSQGAQRSTDFTLPCC
jgi:ankyrin repeat protein